MRLAFWLSLAGVLYTFVGYPALIWILARLRPHHWTAGPIHPSVSIVLPVHNGEPFLRWKIDHLLHLDYANLREIIIVSDGSTDCTADILAKVQHPIVRPIILRDQVGKAAALNAGVSLASAEIVLFVDIRPAIGPGAIEHLVSNFADPRVGCVTGELSLRVGDHDAATSAIGGLYWRYEQWIRKCESAFDSPVGVYGGFYAVRRSVLVNQPDGMILDDMFQPLSIIRQGFRSVLDPSAKVYDTWPRREGEFTRKVRTLAGNYQLFRVAPRFTGDTTVVRSDTDPSWVDIVTGVPAATTAGRVVWTVDAGGAKRLVAGTAAEHAAGTAPLLTPESLNVREVLSVDDDTILFTACADDPASTSLWTAGPDGVQLVSPADGTHTGLLAAGTLLLVSRVLADSDVSVQVLRASAAGKRAAVATIGSRCRDAEPASRPGPSSAGRPVPAGSAPPSCCPLGTSPARASCRCCATPMAGRTASA